MKNNTLPLLNVLFFFILFSKMKQKRSRRSLRLVKKRLHKIGKQHVALSKHQILSDATFRKSPSNPFNNVAFRGNSYTDYPRDLPVERYS